MRYPMSLLLFPSLLLIANVKALDFCFSTGYNGYFISHAPVTFSLAHRVCADQGGTLAKATETNIGYIKDIILDCIGDGESGWISSWNSKVETEQCLEISDSISANCESVNHAICFSNRHFYTEDDARSGLFVSQRNGV